MKNCHPDFLRIEDIRVRTPYLLTVVYGAVLLLIRMDEATMDLLSQVQARAAGRMAVMVPQETAESFYEGEDPWAQADAMGFRLARRQYLQDLYVVRVQVAQAMQEEARKRQVTESYNLFAIWFLFVGVHDLPANDREYVRAMGQKIIESAVYVGGAWAANTVATEVFDAIADIEESRPR